MVSMIASPSAVVAIGEVDDVAPVGARPAAQADRPDAEPHGHAIALEPLGEEPGAARVLAIMDPVARVDDVTSTP